MSWLLETLLGLVLAGLTVAGANSAWQYRRNMISLFHAGFAAAVCLVSIFVLQTWPWHLLMDTANWLVTWLLPNLVVWLFDGLKFVVLTLLVDIVKWLWHLLITGATCWYAWPLMAALLVGFIYFRFTHEHDRQRLRNIAATGAPGQFDLGEALRQVFSPVLNIIRNIV